MPWKAGESTFMIRVQEQGRWSAFETTQRIYYLCKQGSEFSVAGSFCCVVWFQEARVKAWPGSGSGSEWHW